MRTVGAAIIFGTPSLYKGCAAPPASFRAPSRCSLYPRPTRSAALAPGGRLGPRLPAALVVAAWERALLVPFVPRWGESSADTAAAAEPTTPARPVSPASLLGLGPYADLGMQLNVRFELKADQYRNLRCTGVERSEEHTSEL